MYALKKTVGSLSGGTQGTVEIQADGVMLFVPTFNPTALVVVAEHEVVKLRNKSAVVPSPNSRQRTRAKRLANKRAANVLGRLRAGYDASHSDGGEGAVT